MKCKAAWVLASLLLVLAMTLAAPMASAGRAGVPKGALASEINYSYVWYLEQRDDQGRLLVWEGTIAGDFTGEMKWWFGPSPVTTPSEYPFYSARWEIWDGEELLLAGESAGKTVFGADGIGVWDGHGVVTEASGDFSPLKGRRVYETGPVFVLEEPPFLNGKGMFLIY